MVCGGHGVHVTWGMLYLFACTFLWRLSSEALPVVRGDIGLAHNSNHASIVFVDGDYLCLTLKRRKTNQMAVFSKGLAGAANVRSLAQCTTCGPSLRSFVLEKWLSLEFISLYEIFAGGEWRSPAFLEYLALGDLEMGAVIEAHQAESSTCNEWQFLCSEKLCTWSRCIRFAALCIFRELFDLHSQ